MNDIVEYPDAPEGYQTSILLSLPYLNEDVQTFVAENNKPSNVRISMYRNEQNNDDYLFCVNAHDREWKGKNFEETLLRAVRDLTEIILAQSIKEEH